MDRTDDGFIEQFEETPLFERVKPNKSFGPQVKKALKDKSKCWHKKGWKDCYSKTQALNAVALGKKERGAELRTYRCKKCHTYHLTSQLPTPTTRQQI
mgnify:CR=1 FL=1